MIIIFTLLELFLFEFMIEIKTIVLWFLNAED